MNNGHAALIHTNTNTPNIPVDILGIVLFYIDMSRKEQPSNNPPHSFSFFQTYARAIHPTHNNDGTKTTSSPIYSLWNGYWLSRVVVEQHVPDSLAMKELEFIPADELYKLKKLEADVKPLIIFERLGGVPILRNNSNFFDVLNKLNIPFQENIDGFKAWTQLPPDERLKDYSKQLKNFNKMKGPLVDTKTRIADHAHGNILFWAIYRPEIHIDICLALANAPWIDLHAQNACGQTVLTFNTYVQGEVADHLYRYREASQHDDNPLIYQWINEHCQYLNRLDITTKFLVQKKINVNMPTTADPMVALFGWQCVTPLMYAANRGVTDTVRILLDAGANTELTCSHVSRPSHRKFTALDLARENDHPEVVAMIENHVKMITQQSEAVKKSPVSPG